MLGSADIYPSSMGMEVFPQKEKSEAPMKFPTGNSFRPPLRGHLGALPPRFLFSSPLELPSIPQITSSEAAFGRSILARFCFSVRFAPPPLCSHQVGKERGEEKFMKDTTEKKGSEHPYPEPFSGLNSILLLCCRCSILFSVYSRKRPDQNFLSARGPPPFHGQHKRKFRARYPAGEFRQRTLCLDPKSSR